MFNKFSGVCMKSALMLRKVDQLQPDEQGTHEFPEHQVLGIDASRNTGESL